ISCIQQRTLIENLQDKTSFKNKWGSYYFRAPAILKTILENNSEKINPLASLGTIRYPLKTGLNDFFIIDKEKQLQLNIEPEFLVPLLKSPKKITSLLITKSSLEKSLFICTKPKEKLIQEGKMGALNYITWGEQQATYAKQQTREGISWFEVPSVKNHRPYWYSLYHIPYADIFCNRFFDRRFFFCYTKEDILEDQTFYGLILHKEFKKKLMVILAILNSTLSYFMLEFFGRTTLGKGALQFTVNDFKILPILNISKMPILNISKMPKELCSKLELKFKQILSRDIKTIFDEIKEKDRQELDALIFQWLNLTPNQIDQVYNAFIELTSARLMKSGQSIT
ncbi:MAG: TaqI-like C-terminal specificity domain-containing protein, partial [Candidatus Heimdallarchaeota archaeon]